MSISWKIGLGALVALAVGWWLVTLNSMTESIPSPAETIIPVIIEPGDETLNSSDDSGAALQQPGRLSGGGSGAADLQGAATFSPEELNNIQF